jgi:hypothetical protein
VGAARKLGALVQTALPAVEDDPDLRAVIMANVRAQSTRPSTAHRAPALRGYRWAALAAAGLLLMVAMAWRQPALEAAEHSLLRFVDLVDAPAGNPRVASEEQGPPGARLGLPSTPDIAPTLAFEAVVPTTLPHGLRLLNTSHPSPDAVYAEYIDSHGSHFLIAQRAEVAGPIEFDPSNTVLRNVAGLEVLVEANPLTGSVSRAYWSMNGVHVELSVSLELPPGLSMSQAEELVVALATTERRPRAVPTP